MRTVRLYFHHVSSATTVLFIGDAYGVSRAGVGTRYRDRTRQDVESERHMDVTSESRYRVPALAPHPTD